MAKFKAGSIEIDVDEDGFMESPDLWTEDIACALAAAESVPNLTEEHWKVIRYLRDYYTKNGVAPMIRKIQKDIGVDNKRLYALFPSGPAKGACKIAGLAKPTGCV